MYKKMTKRLILFFLHSFLQFSFCLSFTAVCFHASLKLTPLEVGVGLLQLEVTSKEGRLWLPRIVKPIRLFINALVSVRRGITDTFFFLSVSEVRLWHEIINPNTSWSNRDYHFYSSCVALLFAAVVRKWSRILVPFTTCCYIFSNTVMCLTAS